MVDTVDDREERELLDAVERATALVDAGEDPDVALEKVARQYGLGPGKIRLVAHGYNTGRQLSQWRDPGRSSVLDKLARFPLCDPEAVIARVHGPAAVAPASAVRSVRQAADAGVVAADYDRPPRLDLPPARPSVKSAAARPAAGRAAATPADPDDAFDRSLGRVRKAAAAYEECRRAARAARDRVARAVDRVVAYFRKDARDRLSFPQVKAAAEAYFGGGVAALLDLVCTHLPRLTREKQAGDGPVDLTAEPFVLLAEAVKAAAAAADLSARATRLGDDWQRTRSEQFRRYTPDWPRRRSWPVSDDAVKAAAVFAPSRPRRLAPCSPYRRVHAGVEKTAIAPVIVGALAGPTVGRIFTTAEGTPEERVESVVSRLGDPEHENELRKIRVRAALNQMMTDPDDPISSYDPHRVVQVYNEISQVAPRLAENVAALRPVLRKRLEGHTEPFEAKELVEMERTLADLRRPWPAARPSSRHGPSGPGEKSAGLEKSAQPPGGQADKPATPSSSAGQSSSAGSSAAGQPSSPAGQPSTPAASLRDNPILLAVLAGGGLGAAASALTTAVRNRSRDKEDRRSVVSSALQGALAGAGLGLGVGLLRDVYPRLREQWLSDGRGGGPGGSGGLGSGGVVRYVDPKTGQVMQFDPQQVARSEKFREAYSRYTSSDLLTRVGRGVTSGAETLYEAAPFSSVAVPAVAATDFLAHNPWFGFRAREILPVQTTGPLGATLAHSGLAHVTGNSSGNHIILNLPDVRVLDVNRGQMLKRLQDLHQDNRLPTNVAFMSREDFTELFPRHARDVNVHGVGNSGVTGAQVFDELATRRVADLQKKGLTFNVYTLNIDPATNQLLSVDARDAGQLVQSAKASAKLRDTDKIFHDYLTGRSYIKKSRPVAAAAGRVAYTFLPFLAEIGISRYLQDEEDRKTLEELVRGVSTPADAGRGP